MKESFNDELVQLRYNVNNLERDLKTQKIILDELNDQKNQYMLELRHAELNLSEQ